MVKQMCDQTLRDGHDYSLSGDKRRHIRFATQLKALYYMNDENVGLEKCWITNVSYEGLGIQFDPAVTCTDTVTINVGVVVKWQLVPISLKGKMKWLRTAAGCSYGGVALNGPLDNMTLLKLL